MKSAELKIKVKSLAAECTIIRLDENRLKARARRARARQAVAAVDRLVTSFWSLRKHRGQLRGEVRATLLAIAFLRGRPYSDVEELAREYPPLGRAEQIAERFGEERFVREAWDAWEAAATDHAGGFPKALRLREEAKRARAVAAKTAELAATG